MALLFSAADKKGPICRSLWGFFRQIGKGWGISGGKDCGNNAVVPRQMKFFQSQLNRLAIPISQMAKMITGNIQVR